MRIIFDTAIHIISHIITLCSPAETTISSRLTPALDPKNIPYFLCSAVAGPVSGVGYQSDEEEEAGHDGLSGKKDDNSQILHAVNSPRRKGHRT